MYAVDAPRSPICCACGHVTYRPYTIRRPYERDKGIALVVLRKRLLSLYTFPSLHHPLISQPHHIATKTTTPPPLAPHHHHCHHHPNDLTPILPRLHAPHAPHSLNPRHTGNTFYQHILATHPHNTSSQHILTTHPHNTSLQHPTTAATTTTPHHTTPHPTPRYPATNTAPHAPALSDSKLISILGAK